MERAPCLALRLAAGAAGCRATMGAKRDFSASAATALNYGRTNDKYRLDYESVTQPTSEPAAAGSARFLRKLLPDTVITNVKNVQGWRGGAERGFLAEYPDLVHMLSRELAEGNESLVEWSRKVLTHNLSISVLGQRVGLLVPITYRHLRGKDAPKEEMRRAHLLGWGVELLRASTQVSRDTMQSQDHNSVLEQGVPLQGDNSWIRRHDLGPKAFNDATLLQCGINVLLNKHFSGDSRYLHYIQTFQEGILSNSVSNLLAFRNHPSRRPGLAGNYSMKTYKALVRNNVANASYFLPVSLALHLSGLSQASVHQQAKAVFNEVGYFADLNRDYANCYLGDDPTRDIREGRLTWLIVLALQRADTPQRETLERCYGTGAEQDALQVREVYHKLNLAKTFRSHVEEKQRDILQRIQGISKVDQVGLSQEFFFKLIDSMDAQRF